MASLRSVQSAELSAAELEELRALLWLNFGDDLEGGFSEDDWLHSLGGLHVVAEERGRIVAHGSVVPRNLEVDGEPGDDGHIMVLLTGSTAHLDLGGLITCEWRGGDVW